LIETWKSVPGSTQASVTSTSADVSQLGEGSAPAIPSSLVTWCHRVLSSSDAIGGADRPTTGLLQILRPSQRGRVCDASIEAARRIGTTHVDGQSRKCKQNDEEQGEQWKDLASFRLAFNSHQGCGSIRNCAIVVKFPLPGIQGKKTGTW